MHTIRKTLLVALVVASLLPLPWAGASSTRTIDADALQASSHARSFTLPTSAGTGGDTIQTNGSGTLSFSTEVQETPSGTVNGSNTAFTLANTPSAAGTVELTLDGIVLIQGGGNDYTISGTSITMATAPAAGQTLYAKYRK